MKFSCILFDLDGTLLDTNQLIFKSFQHTFKTHLNRECLPEEVSPYFGEPLTRILGRFAPGREGELAATYREFNITQHDALCAQFPGTKETLLHLSEMGVALGVVTSKARSMAVRGLRLYDLERFFRVVVASEDVSRHKPAPEPIWEALKQLELPRDGVLYVGDSAIDIQCAKNAGVKSAAVMWSACDRNTLLDSQPDLVLQTIEDLQKLV